MGKYENLSDGDMSHRNWWREVARAVQDIDARLIALEATQPEKPKALEPGWYWVKLFNHCNPQPLFLCDFGKVWRERVAYDVSTVFHIGPRIPEPTE